MSESIAEMVIPGTYIEVRSEGLIGVGGISTGNIGIVGTASRGPVNTPVLLGSYADALEAFGAYDTAVKTNNIEPLTLTRAIEQAFKGGASQVEAVRIANGSVVKASRLVRTDAADAFTLTAKEGGTYGNQMKLHVVNEGPSASPTSKLTLTYRNVVEVYTGNAEQIRATIATNSTLVDVTTTPAPTTVLTAVDPAIPLGATATGATAGNDQPNVTAIDVATGLDTLVERDINIILVGNTANAADSLNVKGAVADHLENTENRGRERIAIVGAMNSGTSTSVTSITNEATLVNNDRMVLVAPGLSYVDPGTGKPHNLSPSYLAAVVAGKLASLAPHISLTNKELNVDGLDVALGTPAVKSLLGARVLAVRPKFGYQVVKSITTDIGAFKQISIRRTVDYAKAGVRKGCDPYIGRLNNARVRAALKATLDGFLSQMVLDEMLTEYDLEVKANRSQEINGICIVNMTLKPTFSIDYIRVTMTLQ